MTICEYCGADIGPVICCLTRFLLLECLYGDDEIEDKSCCEE